MSEIKRAPSHIRVSQDSDGFWTCREAVSGSQEYVRADICDEALLIINSFVSHYTMGINPFLDEVARRARLAARKIEVRDYE